MLFGNIFKRLQCFAPLLRAINNIFHVSLRYISMLKFTNFIDRMCLVLVNLLFVFSVDLNALPCRPVRCRVLFEDQEPPSRLPTVTTVPDLADHPLGVYMYSVSNVQPRVSLNRLSSSFGFSRQGSPCAADFPSPFVPIFCILLRHFNHCHVSLRPYASF